MKRLRPDGQKTPPPGTGKETGLVQVVLGLEICACKQGYSSRKHRWPLTDPEPLLHVGGGSVWDQRFIDAVWAVYHSSGVTHAPSYAPSLAVPFQRTSRTPRCPVILLPDLNCLERERTFFGRDALYGRTNGTRTYTLHTTGDATRTEHRWKERKTRRRVHS